MRKLSVVLCVTLLCLIQLSLFAGGRREAPMKHNVYGTLGYPTFGAGYEGAIGNYFSLGGSVGYAIDISGLEVLLKPRVYFNSSLERFFIGANLGMVTYSNYYTGGYDYFYGYNDGYTETYIDINAGINLGYKFVFGKGSGGFSLEPSIGVDFLILDFKPRYRGAISLGYAWGGGKAAPKEPRASGDGIYVGIISFGPEAKDLTGGGPILLNAAGLARLETILRQDYNREPQNRPGTALFYANHLALANMRKAESRLPRELESVSLISFTDGIDNQSTFAFLPDIVEQGTPLKEFKGRPIQEYMDFINSEHRSRKVRGEKIEAYSIGVMGRDVPADDRNRFRNALRLLATTEQIPHFHYLENFQGIRGTFSDIADNIIKRWSVTNFRLVSTGAPPGTRIRMTFNNEETHSDADRAPRYLEGTINLRGREYFLTDIKYQGITSNSGREVRGIVPQGEMRIIYNFNGVVGYNPRTEGTRVKQFLWNEDARQWQKNSEYFGDGDSDTRVQKYNALIYLVLDQSNSLLPNEVDDIRTAVTGFIRELYTKYHQN